MVAKLFAGNEAVDWLSQTYQISRPVAISVGEEMMKRGTFFAVDVHAFVDKPVFYTVVREASPPTQAKLAQSLQKVLSGQVLDFPNI
jgi:hypothetical protein